MPFQPNVHDQLTIDGVTYRIAEHPAAPGFPYGQEGRAGIVYCLEPSPSPAGRERGPGGEGSKAALKVFKPRFRLPFLVAQADRMAPFAALPGLRACQRTVLTPFRHADLLRQHPDLTYAVLMPWIEGPTWFDILMGKKLLPPQTSLDLARSLAQVLARMEEQGIAHCDLSGPNVMLPLLAGGTGVELVDLEGLYAPGMTRPQELSSGSAGYAQKQVAGGLWAPEADRFAGAVLLAEMLGWCDPQVVQAAWGESYFAPAEMQRESSRYRTLVEALGRYWGSNVARLFERAWRSDSLLDCPTFGEWLVALPLTPSPQPPSPLPLAGEGKGVAAQPPGEEVRAAAPAAVEAAAEIRALMQAARQLEEESNLPGALTVYRQAQALAVTETGLLAELNAIVQNIQERLRSTPPSTPHFPVVAGRQNEPIEVLFEKGMAAYQAGDWAQAGQWLEQVVQQQPHYRQGSQQAWILLELVRRQMEARKPELVADQLQLLKTYRTQPPGMGGWLRGPSPVEAVAFSPDGQLLAACTVAGEIWIWHLDQETPGYVLKEGGPAFSLVFSPRGDLLVAGSKDGRIIRWRMPERSWIDALQGHHGSVFSVAFSPDGALLASGAQDRVIRVWHIETGQTLRARGAHGSGAERGLLAGWPPAGLCIR